MLSKELSSKNLQRLFYEQKLRLSSILTHFEESDPQNNPHKVIGRPFSLHMQQIGDTNYSFTLR